MKTAIIQWAEWFRDGEAFPVPEDFGTLRNDQLVVVKHRMGVDLGRVKKVHDFDPNNDDVEGKEIIRVADEDDKKKWQHLEKEAKTAHKVCKELSDKHGLDMKLVRAYYSFDDKRLTFTFIADGRIDFRELVKDLTQQFKKLIRLQQIGIRDEARLTGDLGPCGRPLCCATHLQKLESISSDLIDLQQLNHRGSERLSGMCGRLACCLNYERCGYQDMLSKFPPVGARVKTKDGIGVVTKHYLLKNKLDVNFNENDKDGIAEIDLADVLAWKPAEGQSQNPVPPCGGQCHDNCPKNLNN